MKEWFNYPVLTLYVRNQKRHSAEELDKWTQQLLKVVPGINSKEDHRVFDHSDEHTCPESTEEEAHDLFSHDKAVTYESLLSPSEE